MRNYDEITPLKHNKRTIDFLSNSFGAFNLNGQEIRSIARLGMVNAGELRVRH